MSSIPHDINWSQWVAHMATGKWREWRSLAVRIKLDPDQGDGTRVLELPPDLASLEIRFTKPLDRPPLIRLGSRQPWIGYPINALGARVGIRAADMIGLTDFKTTISASAIEWEGLRSLSRLPRGAPEAFATRELTLRRVALSSDDLALHHIPPSGRLCLRECRSVDAEGGLSGASGRRPLVLPMPMTWHRCQFRLIRHIKCPRLDIYSHEGGLQLGIGLIIGQLLATDSKISWKQAATIRCKQLDIDACVLDESLLLTTWKRARQIRIGGCSGVRQLQGCTSAKVHLVSCFSLRDLRDASFEGEPPTIIECPELRPLPSVR